MRRHKRETRFENFHAFAQKFDQRQRVFSTRQPDKNFVAIGYHGIIFQGGVHLALYLFEQFHDGQLFPMQNYKKHRTMVHGVLIFFGIGCCADVCR